MSKPIVFETYELSRDAIEPAQLRLSASDRYITLKAKGCEDEASFYFRDTAKLRELAAKINEAADALEKSQQTTFGDLKAGEWFRFERDGWRFVRRKLGGSSWETIHTDSSLTDGSPSEMTDAAPVVRLAATFTEVTK